MDSDSIYQESFDSNTYEGRWNKYKNGVFAGTLIFFKSTIGIGLLVNQYFVGKSGMILGLVITFLVCFLVLYTLDQMLGLANKIERKTQQRIISFD